MTKEIKNYNIKDELIPNTYSIVYQKMEGTNSKTICKDYYGGINKCKWSGIQGIINMKKSQGVRNSDLEIEYFDKVLIFGFTKNGEKMVIIQMIIYKD